MQFYELLLGSFNIWNITDKYYHVHFQWLDSVDMTWHNDKSSLYTLHSSNMISRRRMIPTQIDRMIAHSGTAAGFCTWMSGNARVVACNVTVAQRQYEITCTVHYGKITQL